MTSAVPAARSRAPTPCAWSPVNATTSQPRKKHRSWVCRAERLTCATTGAVVTGAIPDSSRAR